MTSGATISAALAQSGLVPLDAQVLLAHVIGQDRAWLVAHGGDAIARDRLDAFLALARRRREGEPVAYLTGVREFWGLPLAVSAAVLIPRPETETLVELALARLPEDRTVRVLDLGTGSGAIALAIAHERPRATILATDMSADALDVARANARRLGLANVEFTLSDWYAGLPSSSTGGTFDLIVSNPPYIDAADAHLREGDVRFEPARALTPGSSGTAAILRIANGARERLVPGGSLAVEHGYDQADAVRAMFAAALFGQIVAVRDLAGIPRVVAGTRAG
jgi:release factor glutamine methyltransferase